MTFPGRLLAIDYGLKIIGLALCDPTGTVARPLHLLERTSKKAEFAQIEALIQEYAVVAVIVGLPVSPPEITSYTQADRVRLWASRLAAAISVPVHLWNERYSTQDAEELLAAQGAPRSERVDAIAAAVILQSFLDALHDENFPWPPPVTPAAE